MKLGSLRYLGSDPFRISNGRQILSFSSDEETSKIPPGAILTLSNDFAGVIFRIRLDSPISERTEGIVVGSGTLSPGLHLKIRLIEISGTLSLNSPIERDGFVLVVSKQRGKLYRNNSLISEPSYYTFRDSSGETLEVFWGFFIPEIQEFLCLAPLIPSKMFGIRTDFLGKVRLLDPVRTGNIRKVENQTILELDSPAILIPEKSYLFVPAGTNSTTGLE